MLFSNNEHCINLRFAGNPVFHFATTGKSAFFGAEISGGGDHEVTLFRGNGIFLDTIFGWAFRGRRLLAHGVFSFWRAHFFYRG